LYNLTAFAFLFSATNTLRKNAIKIKGDHINVKRKRGFKLYSLGVVVEVLNLVGGDVVIMYQFGVDVDAGGIILMILSGNISASSPC